MPYILEYPVWLVLIIRMIDIADSPEASALDKQPILSSICIDSGESFLFFLSAPEPVRRRV
jgi:hypothetical protein